MRELYPEIEPYNLFYLKPDELHTIYVEESGNVDGVPVIFLHGGPGSGCNENHRRYFDPCRYRIIVFDQRGTNRSTPRACVEKNTTQHLINDIEAIRHHLKIDKVMLFGGSWGATLALLYAQAYPQQVSSMILRATFLARKQDVHWFMRDGVNRIFPEYWRDFLQAIPVNERHDPVHAYYNRVHGDNEAERYAAIRAWAIWTGRVVTYLISEIDHQNFEPEDRDAAVQEVSIETHYAKNNYFIEEGQILENVYKLQSIPVHIIHGRRDLTCTVDASWELHRSLPQSSLNIVDEGSHLAGEPPTIDALIEATDKMAEIIG